jgi:hypothetical protein
MENPILSDASTDDVRVLLLWWSQTGQLRDAAEAFMAPLEAAGCSVTRAQLRPMQAYPFPWSPPEFFGAFADTVAGPAPALEPCGVSLEENYDLIVLAYQVWFLAPSPPARALFSAPIAKLLADTPVITLVACRNMWYSAAVQMRALADHAGARFAGSVVAVDSSPPWATFVMTPRWLMTGRTDPLLGMPSPGIGAEGTAVMASAGRELAKRLSAGAPAMMLQADTAVDPTLAAVDRLAANAFRAWAHAIRAAPDQFGIRRCLNAAFCVWLVVAIVTVMPVLAIAHRILRRQIEPRTLTWIGRAIRPARLP